ncbi:hypothetical protein N0V82_007575 [Gnomoniopsis sp. IMI 355080]|nr:hypothetical protein N0V82_007575 [Gnomoniopsis sp. IMI 355080]
MQKLLSLATLVSVAVASVVNYYNAGTNPVDLGNIEDADWKVAGKSCWSDAVHGVRALDHGAENFDARSTTPSKCRAACKAEGYALAAVEYSQQCCNPKPVDEAYCNEPCSGDDKQMCGGDGYMNLWVQKGSGNIMDVDKGVDVDPNWSPEACYQFCGGEHSLLVYSRYGASKDEAAEAVASDPYKHNQAPAAGPLPVPPFPKVPDVGDVIKFIKPMVSTMFKEMQSELDFGKDSASDILNRLAKNPSGKEMDAFLTDVLKDAELNAAGPVGDAIAKVKGTITVMFDMISNEVANTKTSALRLLDNLPGHDQVSQEQEQPVAKQS